MKFVCADGRKDRLEIDVTNSEKKHEPIHK